MNGMNKFAQVLLASLLLVGPVMAGDQPDRKLIRHSDPEYPEIAVKMNLHGSVKFRLWINPDGTVRRVEYIGGHPLLAESGLRAVKAWTYESSAKETTQLVELKF
jgi:TonB family protein